jgi:predicted short-subunit dehydrogenase-like oxidoreductase (DUF2520 family)
MVDTSVQTARPSISLIGAGRVGSTLARALHGAGYTINSIWSRTPAHAEALAHQVNARLVDLVDAPSSADLTLLAVSDDSLAGLMQELADVGAWHAGQMVVHCSGVLPVAVLSPAAFHGALTGGFHPLAAIAEREQELPHGITFAVEAAEPLRGILHAMAQAIGGRPFDLQGAERGLYHAAAVLASNYTVVLAALAADLLQRAGLDRDAALPAIMPLLRSTLANLDHAGLPDALTGPLVRGDVGTVIRHLQALDTTAPEIAQVYRALGAAALPLVESRGEIAAETLQELDDALHGVALDATPVANATARLARASTTTKR